jgi:dUTPase
MKLFLKKVPGLILPTQANPSDAGFDIFATTPPSIIGEKISRTMDGVDLWNRVAYVEYGTNLYVAPQREQTRSVENLACDASGAFAQAFWNEQNIDYHILIFPRSSISKYNLVLANSIGLVDNGYRNEIKVRFKYIFQPEDFVTIQEAGGTRIYGIVPQDRLYQQNDRIAQIKPSPNIHVDFEVVKDLNVTERNLGGFGSSGVK